MHIYLCSFIYFFFHFCIQLTNCELKFNLLGWEIDFGELFSKQCPVCKLSVIKGQRYMNFRSKLLYFPFPYEN